MRTMMFVTLLCGMMLMFTATVFAQEDGEGTPEPDVEASVESAPADAIQGIIIIGAGAEATPEAETDDEAESEETITEETAEEADEEESEEEAALGADLLILLLGLGGVFAVGMVMIGRSNFDNNDTTVQQLNSDN